MRSIDPRKLALLLALVFASALLGNGGSKIADPLLGLDLGRRQEHFEPLPAKLATKLGFRAGHTRVFANVSDPGIASRRYMLVSGEMVVLPDREGGGKALTKPDFGSVVEVTGAKAKVLFSADRLLFPPQGDIPAGVREALLTDAVRRLIRAYGGPQKLAQAICRGWKSPDDISQLLRDTLGKMRVSTTCGSLPK